MLSTIALINRNASHNLSILAFYKIVLHNEPWYFILLTAYESQLLHALQQPQDHFTV